MNLKLQINAKGCWTDVVHFDAANLKKVSAAAKALAVAARRDDGRAPGFRVVDERPSRSPKVHAYIAVGRAG